MAVKKLTKLSYNSIKNWYGGLINKPPIPPYDHITQIGDPVLRSPSLPVKNVKSEDTVKVIQALKSTFVRYNSLGLSAPQIGVPLRIIIMQCDEKEITGFDRNDIKLKEMSLLQHTIIINPSIKVIDFTKLVFPECCESVRGFSAHVPRFRSVELKGLNENGQELVLTLTGWMARIAQHEMDHLEGKLYTDIMDKKSFICDCWQIVNEMGGKVQIPFKP